MKFDIKPWIGDARALIGQVILATTITVLLVLSGYAARQGLQSMIMLALSTLLMGARLKSDARWLSFCAAATIASSAAVIAFVLPPGSPRAFPLALAAGFGAWLVVGLILLARGKQGPLLARRPEAWTWLIGAATWLAISLTYADASIVVRAGSLAPYLWIPWATLAFLMGTVGLPWATTKKPPKAVVAFLAWTRSTTRGVIAGVLIALSLGFVLAQVVPVFLEPTLPGATLDASAPAAIDVSSCLGCDPSSTITALEVSAREGSTLLSITFAAAPDALRVLAADGDVVLDLELAPDGWRARATGFILEADGARVEARDNVLFVLLSQPELQGGIAVEAPEGNWAPEAGYARL